MTRSPSLMALTILVLLPTRPAHGEETAADDDYVTVVTAEGTDSSDLATPQMVDVLEAFMTDGEVPENGSVGIFGTQMFYGNVFVGNRVGGGFGEVEKGAEPY